MFGLDLKLAIGAGLAVGGILLLAFTGEPEAPKEPVAITPHRRVYRRIDIHRLAGIQS